MIILPPASLAPSIVAAVKGSVGEQGLNQIQIMTMESIAHDIMKADVDVETMEALTPEQAALAIEDPQIRLQVLQAMLALEMLAPVEVDGVATDEGRLRVSTQQADRIDRYAKAFGINLSQLHTFRDRAQGHLKMMYIDLFARTPLRRAAIKTIKDDGIREFVKNVAAMRGHGTSEAIANKYRRLEDLPDGTWGKQLAHMYQTNGWPYPGESHGVTEPTAMHDWVHVISGYPPTAVGELQVNAYMHATSDDPASFGTIVLALSLYGIGNISLPIGNFISKGAHFNRPDVGHLYSEAVLRSKASGIDLFNSVDHWANAALAVDQIREQYGVPAKEIDIGEGDPGLINYQPG